VGCGVFPTGYSQRGISNGVFPTGYFQRGISNGVFPVPFLRILGYFSVLHGNTPGYLTPGIPNGVFNPGYFLSFSRSVVAGGITSGDQRPAVSCLQSQYQMAAAPRVGRMADGAWSMGAHH
jgi:hypothetical protein